MDINIKQKKEFIVFTAIDLIHENGINNVSTKEIAKRIGISEASIFKIYPKKYDLILAVLDHFSLYDNDLFHTALEKSEDAVEAILFLMNKILIYYENYPVITSVFHMLDNRNGIPQIDNKAMEIDNNRYQSLKQLVLKAQTQDLIDPNTDADMVTDIIYSTFKGLCVRWSKMNFGFPLQERTITTIRFILNNITK